MTQESLRELLARVHEHLSGGGSLDRESQQMLGTLIEAGIAEGRKDPRPRDGVQRFKGLGEMPAPLLY